MENPDVRLDQYLTLHHAESRSKAIWMIEQGMVYVNGSPERQKSRKIKSGDVVEVRSDMRIYVSKGGYKLEKALKEFGMDLQGKTVLDIGASTGGFSDCALQFGAKQVVAIDIGTGQIHPSLLENPNLISLENTDIRTLDPKQLPIQEFDLIVVDVSFISLEHVFPYLGPFLGPNGKVIALLKPQFEQREKRKYKKGIIREEKIRLEAIGKVKQHIIDQGFEMENITQTDADGITKNIEYLLLLKKNK